MTRAEVEADIQAAIEAGEHQGYIWEVRVPTFHIGSWPFLWHCVACGVEYHKYQRLARQAAHKAATDYVTVNDLTEYRIGMLCVSYEGEENDHS